MQIAEKQLLIGDFNANALENAVSFNPESPKTNSQIVEEYPAWNEPIKCMPHETGHQTAREIVKLIEKNYYNFGGWANAFDTVVDIILYALTGQEEDYLKTVKGLKKEALDCAIKIYSMLFKALYYDFCIHDILGEAYMQVGSLSRSKHFGQFFTPMHICDFMARIQLGNVKEQIRKAKEENKKIKINDPCVGSGAMLLACKKAILEEAGIEGLDYFEFYGMDIDWTCINMCKIQMILTDYRYMANLLLSKALEIRQKTNLNKNVKQHEPISSLIA